MIDAYKLINTQLTLNNQELRLRVAENQREIVRLNREIQNEKSEKSYLACDLKRISDVLETLKDVITSTQSQIANALGRDSSQASEISYNPTFKKSSMNQTSSPKMSSSSPKSLNHSKTTMKVPPIVKTSNGQHYHPSLSITLPRLDPRAFIMQGNDNENDSSDEETDNVSSESHNMETSGGESNNRENLPSTSRQYQSDNNSNNNHNEESNQSSSPVNMVHNSNGVKTSPTSMRYKPGCNVDDTLEDERFENNPINISNCLTTVFSRNPLTVITETEEFEISGSYSLRNSKNKENNSFLDNTVLLNWSMQNIQQPSTSTPINRNHMPDQPVVMLSRLKMDEIEVNKVIKIENEDPEYERERGKRYVKNPRARATGKSCDSESTTRDRPQRKRQVKSFAEPKLNSKMRRQ